MFEQIDRQATVAAADRRRPGRAEYANPYLIRLLRGTPAPLEPVERTERRVDGLAAARGIGASAILGAMAWAGILTAVWLLHL